MSCATSFAGNALAQSTNCPGEEIARTEARKVAENDPDAATNVSILDALAVAGSGKSMLATTQLARVFTPIGMISTTETYPALGSDLTSDTKNPSECHVRGPIPRHNQRARRK